MLCRFTFDNNRFAFVNEFIKPGKGRKLRSPWGGSKAVAEVQHIDGQMILSAKRGDLLVNDQPLAGQHSLVHGDRITFVPKKPDKQKDWVTYTYIYQTDLEVTRAARLEEEKAANIQHQAPNFEGDQRYQKWLRDRFKISENGIEVKGLSGRKELSWDDFSHVSFANKEPLKKVNLRIVGEVAAAMSQPGTVVGYREYTRLFGNDMFIVVFHRPPPAMTAPMLQQVQARNAVLIAQALDYYAPKDVLNFK